MISNRKLLLISRVFNQTASKFHRARPNRFEMPLISVRWFTHFSQATAAQPKKNIKFWTLSDRIYGHRNFNSFTQFISNYLRKIPLLRDETRHRINTIPLVCTASPFLCSFSLCLCLYLYLSFSLSLFLSLSQTIERLRSHRYRSSTTVCDQSHVIQPSHCICVAFERWRFVFRIRCRWSFDLRHQLCRRSMTSGSLS